jgi:hypothetical protein
MKEIETLHYYPITDGYGNCYGMQDPSMREVVDKVNEIIDVINKLQSDVEYLKAMEEKHKVYKVIRRYDVLMLVKQKMLNKEFKGLCIAMRESLDECGLTRPATDFFPEFYKSYALKFGAKKSNKHNGYWWKPCCFGILSGRRRYLNWLIRKYKDNGEILNTIEQ